LRVNRRDRRLGFAGSSTSSRGVRPRDGRPCALHRLVRTSDDLSAARDRVLGGLRRKLAVPDQLRAFGK
jgi:hypothetical protein